ncbi:hypothetical protein [Pantoea agglomerans]|uniref:hypothetical protein n=1 Tax=Enterobacter agglomerans TaxID=549 RepID=UPI00241320C3|nr:hypothetical protein [Pantoea agglomerans]
MKQASFLTKLAVVFFLLAIACGFAGWGAWKYWHAIFISLSYGITDFTRLNAENQAMKTPLNLTMYAMPVGFWCAAAGFLVASGLAFLLDAVSDVVAVCARTFSRKKARGDHHA